MAYQSGEEAISDGVSTVSVVFAPAFGAEPDIVIAVVQNTVDNPQLSIQAQVTAKSATGFTVDLDSATDSANYELSWLAGAASLVFEAVTKLGMRVGDLPRPARPPRGNDLLVMVQDGATVAVPFAHLESFFARSAAPPSAPTDPGTAGQLAVDDTGFFAHNGTAWLRMGPLGHATDWTISTAMSAVPMQGGSHAFADLDTDAVVTFDESFPSDGAAPLVLFSIRNTVDPTPTAITGVVTAVSLTGFTVEVSPAIDSDNHILDWVAFQY